MSAQSLEKKVRAIEVTPEQLEEIRKYVQRAKVVTPQSLALKYDIRVSVARKLLREFQKEGLVVYVDGNSRLRIYKGAKA
ncbi:MAG TPA: 30S ribosomal protein S25e [Candidatus Korarchaeota archaeon]|nr:30S ribosomal protein S25e [Candidatus Korarchaeota archaeon]